MQFRKILFHLAFSSLALSAGYPALAQEIRTNEKKEKIIVYPDGSWQYFSNFLVGGDEIYTPSDSEDAENLYPVFEGEVESMEHPAYSLTEEHARKIATRQAQLAREAVFIAEKRAKEATRQRTRLEEEMEKVKKRLSEEDSEYRELQARLNLARRTEQETEQEARFAQKEAERTEELIQKGDFLEEIVAQQQSSVRAGARTTGTDRLNDDFFNSIVGLDNPAANYPHTTPGNNCRLAYEGVDEYTKQRRRDVQKQLLFTHTDERLRPYLEDKEYMTCEGFMSSLAGGYRFFTLQFTFAYPNAREAYGFIEKGSYLMVRLLNGDFVTLRSGTMDRGRWDTERELLTYSVHYPVDRSQLNILRRSELDSLLVFWSSGYEEYDVYEVGFFINQLACLEN